jgi:hypothetical protein
MLALWWLHLKLLSPFLETRLWFRLTKALGCRRFGITLDIRIRRRVLPRIGAAVCWLKRGHSWYDVADWSYHGRKCHRCNLFDGVLHRPARLPANA